MTKKSIQRYTQNLRSKRDRFIGKVSNSIQEKINNIVDLYEDRKIVPTRKCRQVDRWAGGKG